MEFSKLATSGLMAGAYHPGLLCALGTNVKWSPGLSPKLIFTERTKHFALFCCLRFYYYGP